LTLSALPKGDRRLVLVIAVVAVSLLALLPLLTLLQEALLGGSAEPLGLGFDGPAQIRGTLLLVAGEGLLGALIGTANGWLTAACRFPGRRLLRIAQLIPLAIPSYLLAASLIDWGSRQGLHIHGLGWAITVLTLANYTYVFLLSTESFAVSGRRLLEASRSLGVGPWSGFFRVALPIALPSIGAGVALSAMEVVNELGAVRLLGVPSLSAGILDLWQVQGDPRGAALLSLVALALVALLIAMERRLRSRSRRWNLGGAGEHQQAWELSGWRALLAQLVTALPPLLTLAIPVLWVQQGWEGLGALELQELAPLAGRSLMLALAATLGLMVLGGPLLLSPMLLLVWGYGDRFMAVSKQGLDAALERIPPSIDETAASLGSTWLAVLQRIHLPLLRGPLLVGSLLVFVDVVKELPITLALRPFDFDTLAVRVFQYASDERVGAAMGPALLIMVFGLAAALALIPSLERQG
jgi:iron(III) transport system permease protein